MTKSEEPRPRATVIDLSPRRLREGDGPAAGAARVFHEETAAPIVDEATAWHRLTFSGRRSTARARRAWRWWLAGTTLAVGAAAAALVLWPARPSDHREESPVVAATPAPEAPSPNRPAPATATPTPPAAVTSMSPSLPLPRSSRLALSASPRTLPARQIDLDGEAHVDLAPGGHAVASTDAGNTRVSLSHGSLRLDVVPREPGRRFQVEVGPYRFVVVGTSFRVARSGSKVELWVSEGRVAVWRAEHLGPMVAAGGHWAGTVPAEATPAMTAAPPSPPATEAALPHPPVAEPSPSVVPPPRPPVDTPARRPVDLPLAPPVRSDALVPCEAAVGAGRSREALDCYRRIADGKDSAAELALYEVARLQLRLTGDVRAALETLSAHARRFPNGTLRSEVELTRVELLPRVGDHRRALELSDRILAEHPNSERRRELHLLRGNIFREALGDCARAEPEYRAATDGAGAVADDADFYRAVCIEILGRPSAETAAAYRAYLTRARPAHRAEAQKRLSMLQP